MPGRLTVEEILRGKKPKKKAPPPADAPAPPPATDTKGAKRALTKAELKKQPPLTITEKDEFRKIVDGFSKWAEDADALFKRIGDERIRAFTAEHGPLTLVTIVSASEGIRKALGLLAGKTKNEDGAMVSISSFLPDPSVVDENDVPPLTTPNFSIAHWIQFIVLCISSLRKIHGPAAAGPVTTILLYTAFELFAQERMREAITKEIMDKMSGPLGKAIREKLIPIILKTDGTAVKE